jgi:hypothetical protein
MTGKDEDPDRQPDRSDQLSPSQALRESLGASASQRIGDNGPIANPIVSFPDDPGDETTGGEGGG